MCLCWGGEGTLRTKDSKELISHDASSNTFNYKYTFKAEVIPICKVFIISFMFLCVVQRKTYVVFKAAFCAATPWQDDLVVLPPKLFSRVATASPLLLCSKISGLLHLVDPFTTQSEDIFLLFMPFGCLPTACTLLSWVVVLNEE